MRLDFSNLGKGLVAIADAKKTRDLAQEAAKYRVTEGEYGTGLQSNISQVEGMKQQAVAGGLAPEQAAAQYDPAIQELTRRSGLTAPDYSVASRGTNYANMADARAAAAPRRTEGLANVYERYGDLEQADTLRTRAAEQEYAAQMRPLQRQALEGQIAGQALSQRATQQQLDEADRRKKQEADTALARQRITDLRAKGTLRPQDIMSVASEFGLDPKEFLSTEDAVNTAEYRDLKRSFRKAAAGDISGMNEFLASRFDPDKTDNVVPRVVQDKNGVRVMYGNRELTAYGRHKSFQDLVMGVQVLIDEDPVEVLKTLAQIESSRAQARTSGASAPSSLRQKLDDFKTAFGREPTEAEKLRLFRLDSRPEKEPSPADITARARMYMESDQSGALTAQQALAMAERDFGLRSGPTNAREALVDAAISGAKPAPAKSSQQATPAGQQLLGLYNVVVPPAAAPATTAPMTSEERQRRLFLGLQ